MRDALLPLLAVLTLALALACPAAAAPDAATAAAYTYPLRVEDPAGDQLGLAPVNPPAPNPGDANPENDVLAFEATNDATTLVVRYTMATVSDFTAPGPVTLTLSLTGPADEDWEATISYGDGGSDPAVADFDPASGDDDVLVPGATAAVDAAASMVYLFVDLAEAGLAVGDAVKVDAVGCGKGVTVPGAGTVTENGRDTVDVTDVSYTVAGASSTGGEPLRVFKTANGTALREAFETPTNATVQYNVTSSFTVGRIGLDAEVLNGSVQVLVLDAGNATLANVTLDATGNQTLDFEDAEAGAWTVRLGFAGFAGSVNVTISPPPEPTPTESPSTSSESNSTSAAPEKEDKGSPGLGLPLLLVATVAVALLVRRRAA